MEFDFGIGENPESDRGSDDDGNASDEGEPDRLELLIESVRSRRYLYDQSKKDSKNSGKKELAWLEVASEVKEEVKWCKGKWKYLRDNYVKKKKALKGKSGSAAKKITAWRFFALMKFLDNFTGYKKTTGNLGHTDVTTKELSQPSSPTSPDGTGKDNMCDVEEASSSTATPITKRMKPVDPVDSALVSFLNRPKEAKDVHHHFCLSLADDMRKMTDSGAAYARLKIQELMFNLQYSVQSQTTDEQY